MWSSGIRASAAWFSRCATTHPVGGEHPFACAVRPACSSPVAALLRRRGLEHDEFIATRLPTEPLAHAVKIDLLVDEDDRWIVMRDLLQLVEQIRTFLGVHGRVQLRIDLLKLGVVVERGV